MNGAETWSKWKAKNWYYHKKVRDYFLNIIPSHQSVMEVGCGVGELLAALKPSRGLGIDHNAEFIQAAKDKYPNLEFRVDDLESLSTYEKFDYVVMSDVVGELSDIQRALANLRQVTTPETRLVISYYNYLWEPILKLAEKFGWKRSQRLQNWLSRNDLDNLLNLAGYEVIRTSSKLIFPKYIPLFSAFLNRFVGNLPFLSRLSLVRIVVAREMPSSSISHQTCSVIVPARNEKGTIEEIISGIPQMGKRTEIIFIEGGSTDGTRTEIERLIKLHPEREIRLIKQEGKGKGDAVRMAFEAARGEVLMILDADLSVAPEYLPRFYDALREGKGEFINGSRLVYQLEKESMRFLNLFANKMFGLIFTYLLEQPIKDTLCGTKALFKKDYEKIVAGRSFFGDFDPFGDFDLLFGACKLDLKIVEIPVRYQARVYGQTNISRFRHGILLFKMCGVALWKLKFV